MSWKDCIDEIFEAAEGALTREEAEEILSKFSQVTKRWDPAKRLNAMTDVLSAARMDMTTRNEVFNLHAKRVSLMAQVYETNLGRSIEEYMADNPKATFRQAFHRLFYGDAKIDPSKQSKDSISLRYEGARNHLNYALLGKLEQGRLLGAWSDPEVVDQALNVMWDPKAKVDSPQAQQIGMILRDVQTLASGRLNDSGAYVLDTPRVILNSKIADPAKVKAMGREGFISFVRGLEMDEAYWGTMTDEEIDTHLGKVYKRIWSQNAYKAPTGTFDGIGGLIKSRYQNLASTNSLDYDIPFASADSFRRFAQELSDEPIQAFINRRVEQIGRAVAMMQVLGPTPEQSLERIIAKFAERMGPDDAAFLLRGTNLESKGAVKATDAKAKDIALGVAKAPFKLVKEVYHDASPWDALAYMDGTTSAPVKGSMARIGSGIRAWGTMASLGWSVFTQITDVPIKMAVLASYGKNPFATLATQLGSVGSAFAPKERQLLYARLGVSAQMMQHSLARQAGNLGYSPHSISRAMDMYFKLNLMEPMDRISKYHTVDEMTSHFAWGLNNPEDGAQVIDILKAYGFAPEDLRTLKNATRDMQGVEAMDMDFLELADDRVYERYLGMMDDIIRKATPTPGVREQAITLKGTRPGTWSGELLRTVMMFKKFPIKLMTDVYPHIHYNLGVGGTASTMVGLLFFWYIGDSLKALAQGRTPRDMSKPENMATAFLRSGAGGIYSDLMSAEYHRHGMDMMTTIGGPIAGRLNEVAAFGSSAVRGEASPAMARHLINSSLPNVHLGKNLLDKALIHGMMELHEPGYEQRSLERLRERTGQEQLF